MESAGQVRKKLEGGGVGLGTFLLIFLADSLPSFILIGYHYSTQFCFTTLV